MSDGRETPARKGGRQRLQAWRAARRLRAAERLTDGRSSYDGDGKLPSPSTQHNTGQSGNFSDVGSQ